MSRLASWSRPWFRTAGIWLTWCGFPLLAIAEAPRTAPPLRLWSVGAAAEPATFAGFEDGDRIAFRVDGQRRVLAWQQLVCWGRLTDSSKGARILLADGSQLIAEILEVRDQRVVVDSSVFGLLQIPLTNVRGLLCVPPLDPLQRDRICLQIAAADGVEDRLILPNGERVPGVVEAIRVAEQGRNAGLPVIAFAARGRTLELPLLDVLGVVFNPALVQTREAAGAPVLVGLRDGSLLRAQRLGGEQDSVALELATGGKLSASRAAFANALTLIQPLASVTYVSDLPPLGDTSIPFLQIAWPPTRDLNVHGGRLRSSGTIYAKGLGMRSSSRSAFRLDADYATFQSEVALDDQAGRGGSVIFKLFQYDASGQWQSVWESPIVRGGDPPLPVSADIRDARALALIVEFADRGDVQDDANWLNPCLLR